MGKTIMIYGGFEIDVKDDGITPIECHGCGWDFDKNVNKVACFLEQKCLKCCECGVNL